ncbi:MAG TPA: mannose-1-phosphate guanylyltransferase [candidate division Zixibacteria bacterium]|nr:mannose-1-phosphate guanylyltransferase [candidate division Zixibacteria bacterium]
MACFCVIMAGGRGTRFWPLSRARRPKQLLKILGPKSLIREAVERAIPLGGAGRTLVVTVSEQLDDLAREIPMLPRRNFLAEPVGRNTAPCIGLAALEVSRRDPEAVMVVLPADHWIAGRSAFRRTLRTAVRLASRTDDLITIGIRPGYPETGYGYIVKGAPIKGSPGAFRVAAFKEKPNRRAAFGLIRRGALWNSGIFVWRAAAWLSLLERHQPKIAERLDRIRSAAGRGSLAAPNPRLRRILAREYRAMPAISADHAVLEKAGAEGRIIVVAGEFAWSDVGSWAAVHRMMRRDRDGNAGNGRWVAVGARDCLVHSPERLVVLLGVRGVVVVDTPDALLVGDLERSQEVRDLVQLLERRGYRAYTAGWRSEG